MRNILAIVALVFVAYGWLKHAAPPFEHPVPLAVERSGAGTKQFEFEQLLESDTPFEALARPGYYTIVEDYSDSCGACRALERELPVLLDARRDVVLRRVRFKENGGKRFNGHTAAEVQAEIAAYAARLKRYRSFYVVDSEDGPGIGTCGTPHVEIYGPDGELLATDYCEGTVYKHGLGYLRDWIAAERTL